MTAIGTSGVRVEIASESLERLATWIDVANSERVLQSVALLRALAAERDAVCKELAECYAAINAHNDGCQSRCGVGDQEAVSCGYRPYLLDNGRRCPQCPTYETIEMP